MDIVIVITIVVSLFAVIGFAEPLAARLRLPYTVILAMLGVLIGVSATFFLRTHLTDALNPVAEAILSFPIRSNVFLYLFLPTLLFQATLGMNLRRVIDDWVPILVMAVVAVVVATLFVGYALSWVSALPLAGCLLIGAIISTTDPSAVVSIFRSFAAPSRLVRIIEGESLLNDAAAIALFGLFMGFVTLGMPDPNLGDALARFPLLMLGGAVTGWIVARIALWSMALFANYDRAQISISVALPYLAYIIAEQSVGASGVIAVVVSGLTLAFLGPGRLSPASWGNLREVWDLLAHWSGSLIFILAALLIPRMLEEVRLSDFWLLAVVILAATAARAAVLYGLLPVLNQLRLSPPVERPYRTAILWGGLRGAVTLALALAVTESLRIPLELKRLVGILATGYVLFTLIVQGTTLRMVIAWLGLDRLSPLDEALSRQVVAVSLQTVREDIAETSRNYELTHDIVRSEAKQFGERLEDAVRAAEESKDILDRDRITLGLIALAGAERDTILSCRRERTISARMSEQLLNGADRLIESTRTNGRTGYRKAAQQSTNYGPSFRLALLLHNTFRLPGMLARMTADRFEFLLSLKLILRDLDDFIGGRIRRIHGRRVADLLAELLARRIETVDTALEGLRLQYPGYADELERRFIRRTALRLETREYAAMRDDGLIGSELFIALMQDVATRESDVEERPKLDIAVQKAELARQVPIFASLGDSDLRRLARVLKTTFVDAGELIVARNSPPKGVFFIALGAVELKGAGHTWRLGRGEMFGQMAILTQKPFRTDARAIAPSILLVLDEARFRRLLAKNQTLQEAVTAGAAKRGLELPMDFGG
ncbi:cation:proton antiporter [Tateyamaria armeniaca]|uniref:Cation:proton antiporter n=1 Tax=Tateyamaria armeniaca TaxID=2518930 RepID=A0ABW8UP31_9RHOB